MKILKEAELLMTSGKHNKVYHIAVFQKENSDECGVIAIWGRRGDKLIHQHQVKIRNVAEWRARSEFNHLVKSKRKKGYYFNPEVHYEVTHDQIVAMFL